MLLLTLATLAPWGYRNYRALGEWVWTSTNAGITSYDGWNPDATGASDQRFVARMPQLRGMGEVGRNTYLAELARAFVRENPARAVQLAAIKVARTWSPMPLSAEFSRPAYIAVALCYAVPLDLLALVGLVISVLPRRTRLLLVVPAIYLTVGAAITVGSLRYRVPAEPFLACLVAGVAVNVRKEDTGRSLSEEELSDGARTIPLP